MASSVDLLVLNVRVKASWDVVFDVLENQFLKALQIGGVCHRAVFV